MNSYDDVLSIPPKGFEEVVKSLEDMREKLKDKNSALSYEVPEDVKYYLQNMHNPEMLPEEFEKLPHKIQHQWMKKYYAQYLPNYPESLTMLFPAMLHPGDNGRDPDEVPDWLDREKFRRGQRIVEKNFFEISFSALLAFLSVYTFEDGIRPIVLTKQSSTPSNSYRRYSLVLQIYWSWCTGDPWTKGTEAYKHTQFVRRMHKNVREQVCKRTVQELIDDSTIKQPWCPMREQLKEEFQTVCPAVHILQRIYVLLQDYPKKAKNVNQADMFVTQFAFVVFTILYPEKIGIHDLTEEDIDDFCHFWRSLGFLLGIYDEYNVCNGSLEEVRQRLRDIIDQWVKPNFRDIAPEWEHLVRCMLEGVSYYYIKIPFETILLSLTDVIDMPMPRLRASLSLYSWIMYNLIKLYNHYLAKVAVIKKIANAITIYYFKNSWKRSKGKLAKIQEMSNNVMSKNSIVV